VDGLPGDARLRRGIEWAGLRRRPPTLILTAPFRRRFTAPPSGSRRPVTASGSALNESVSPP
jgi:hypothetical protein